MKHATTLFTLLALLALVLLPTSSARAMGPFDGGPVIFGGSYTLESGDTLNGDLVVFGGNVTIEEEAIVQGSIVIFGGNITLDGTLTQDLVLIGGSGSMGEQSVIEGDLVTVGGSMSRAEGSRIEGDIQENPTIEIPPPTLPEPPQVPEPPQPNFDFNFNPIGSAFGVLGQAILIAALAMLLSLFMRPQMERVAQVLFQQPLVAGGVGLLSVPAVIITALILIITIIGPVILVISFIAAWLFGIVSIGMEIGERFTKSIGQSWAPVLTAGFGTFMFQLIIGGIGIIPCFGWMLEFLVGALGVGAVVLAILDARKQSVVAAPASGAGEPLPPAS